MAKHRCIVYNLEQGISESARKEFLVGVNGVMCQGKCEVEIDLDEKFIHALNNAQIERWMIDPELPGKKKMVLVPRFRVILLNPRVEEEKKKPGRPKGTSGRPRWDKPDEE